MDSIHVAFFRAQFEQAISSIRGVATLQFGERKFSLTSFGKLKDGMDWTPEFAALVVLGIYDFISYSGRRLAACCQAPGFRPGEKGTTGN